MSPVKVEGLTPKGETKEIKIGAIKDLSVTGTQDSLFITGSGIIHTLQGVVNLEDVVGAEVMHETSHTEGPWAGSTFVSTFFKEEGSAALIPTKEDGKFAKKFTKIIFTKSK